MASFFSNVFNKKTPAQTALQKQQGFGGLYGSNVGKSAPGGFNYAFPQQAQPVKTPAPTTPAPAANVQTAMQTALTQPGSYTPQSYAKTQESLRDATLKVGQTYAPLIAAPFGGFSIGDKAKNMSEYEVRRRQAELEPLQQATAANEALLTASLPAQIGPTETTYNPLGGAGQEGGVAGRVQRAAAIGQLGTQSGNLVDQQLQNQRLQSIGSIVASKVPGAGSGISAIDALSKDVIKQFSPAEMNQFVAALNSLADIVPEQAAVLRDLTKDGVIKGSDVDAVKSFLRTINQAQQANIAATQGTIGNLAGQVGGSPFSLENW